MRRQTCRGLAATLRPLPPSASSQTQRLLSFQMQVLGMSQLNPSSCSNKRASRGKQGLLYRYMVTPSVCTAKVTYPVWFRKCMCAFRMHLGTQHRAVVLNPSFTIEPPGGVQRIWNFLMMMVEGQVYTTTWETGSIAPRYTIRVLVCSPKNIH